jgi:hypothetical protein
MCATVQDCTTGVPMLNVPAVKVLPPLDCDELNKPKVTPEARAATAPMVASVPAASSKRFFPSISFLLDCG